jgi:hypothetical protein
VIVVLIFFAFYLITAPPDFTALAVFKALAAGICHSPVATTRHSLKLESTMRILSAPKSKYYIPSKEKVTYLSLCGKIFLRTNIRM